MDPNESSLDYIYLYTNALLNIFLTFFSTGKEPTKTKVLRAHGSHDNDTALPRTEGLPWDTLSGNL